MRDLALANSGLTYSLLLDLKDVDARWIDTPP